MNKNEKREIKRAKYQRQAAKAQAKADRLQTKARKSNAIENTLMGIAVIGIVALAVAAAITGSSQQENE